MSSWTNLRSVGAPMARLAVVAAMLMIGSTSAVSALEPPISDVEGAADFRTAPLLTPGTYTDSVVAGESVWYSVLYPNDATYEVVATLRDAAPEGSEFLVALVGPTLGVLQEEAGTITGSASYSAGGTNTWFVRLTLVSPTEVGGKFAFELSVNGFAAGSPDLCEEIEGCDAAERSAEAAEELEAARAELSEAQAGGTEEAVTQRISELEQEIPELEGQLEPVREIPVALCVLLILASVGLVVGAIVLRGKRIREA